ncbi:MAG TPA: crosslink repair DNA glycosylase YcaQ family protein [Mycobacteriales bacterium]|nr:crosslink repair DNA glycosylase YcaQ family protein [Mycobacteriales bacterium]
MDELTAVEARRLAVRAQGLAAGTAASGARGRAGGVAAAGRVGAVLRHVGAVQLDTISVLARSHELVAYARLGAVPRAAVEAAYWSEPATAFEYWSHAACILPIEEWPAYGVVRREQAARQHPRRRTGEASRAAVLAALRERGPLTATELGGAKRGGVWWDWSDTKIAAEDLFRWGEVVVTRRTGWRRVYDLPERAIPAPLLGTELSDDECRRRLLAHAGAALGVATAADLARYFSAPFGVASAGALAADAGLVPVRVAGWRDQAWAAPDALAALSAGAVPTRSRTTLLSPFDSLVWYRERMERLFGMRHRLEAYTPKEKREYGYFAMPVLTGGRLVGRVDPARAGRTLVARQVTFELAALGGRAATGALAGTAAALREAATWVGCDAVAVERVSPPELAAPLRAAVA